MRKKLRLFFKLVNLWSVMTFCPNWNCHMYDGFVLSHVVFRPDFHSKIRLAIVFIFVLIKFAAKLLPPFWKKNMYIGLFLMSCFIFHLIFTWKVDYRAIKHCLHVESNMDSSVSCSWQKLIAPLFAGNNHGVTVELEGLGGGGTIEIEVRSLPFYFPGHRMQRCIL